MVPPGGHDFKTRTTGAHRRDRNAVHRQDDMLSSKCTHRWVRKTLFRTLLLSLNIPFALAGDWQRLDDLVFVPAPMSSVAASEAALPAWQESWGNSLAQPGAYRADESPAAVLSGAGVSTRDYENRIIDIENDAGPFATELTEVLHSLGGHYLDERRYDEALASYEREEHIYRVNFGLFSEQQVPAVKAQIRAMIDGRMVERADDKQRYLIYLMEKCYGPKDMRLLPELVSYADWNMSRFNRIIRFEFSDMGLLSLGTTMGTKEEFRLQAYDNLRQAVEHYARAVNLLVDHERFDDPQLYRLENRLLESALFQASQRQMVRDPDHFLNDLDLEEAMYEKGDYSRMVRDAYQYGVESYQRQLAYIVNAQGNMARYIDTLMAFGDWYMLFGKQAAAFGKYEEANGLLSGIEVSTESVDAVLRPAVPVVMPTFTATPQSVASLDNTDRMMTPYKGYVDVSFRINRNGGAKHLEVLDSSANTTRSIERRLLKLLAEAHYRPRFDDGMDVTNEEVALRYYYTY